jgi:hypothetical protein
LEEAAENTRKEITSYCDMEGHRPFTLNKQYLAMKEEWLTAFALRRHQNTTNSETSRSFKLIDSAGTPRSFPASEGNLVSVLSAYGIHVSSVKQLARIHEDEYDAELEVISHITAYFDIASKRIVDDIPKVFERIFAYNFGRELDKYLAKNLTLVGDGGVENCKRYIRDEPHIQSRRDELIRQKDILKKAISTVESFHKVIVY